MAREIVSILQRHGFVHIPSRRGGSHQKWRHPETKKVVIVSFHRGGQVLPIGTLMSIIKGSGLPDDAWE